MTKGKNNMHNNESKEEPLEGVIRNNRNNMTLRPPYTNVDLNCKNSKKQRWPSGSKNHFRRHARTLQKRKACNRV
jgi:hypothetical protein